MRIDAHQHFWKYDPVKDAWITDDMQIIRKDFLPKDIQPLLAQNNFGGCMAVQADQSETETDFLIELAHENDFIKGIVGWVDLRAADVKERLEHYSQFKIVKGFRHILQAEAQRDLMLQSNFKNGMATLQSFSFTFDLLIFPDQLPFAKKLAALFPEQKFVLDHLAKPYIKLKKIDEWKNDMQAIAPHENVYCKLSGMTTEADWQHWEKDDLKPYIDVVVKALGMDRILFGSDWPVCLLAASYNETVDIVKDYFSSFSIDEQNKIFGQNAIKFYNL
ncbi:MAG: amidohydrolase family protein [Flavisolibacter sp.]